MGFLEILFGVALGAGLTANIKSNHSSKVETEYLEKERAIKLSSDFTNLEHLNMRTLTRSFFMRADRDVIQISKSAIGKDKYGFPLFWAETNHTTKKDSISIIDNPLFYQKEFLDSSFAILTHKEVSTMVKYKEHYKIMKIHTKPIITTDKEWYVCEINIFTPTKAERKNIWFADSGEYY